MTTATGGAGGECLRDRVSQTAECHDHRDAAGTETDKKVSRAERLLLVRHQAQLDLLIHALSCLLLLLVPVEIV